MAATAGFTGYVKIGTTSTPTNKMSGVTDIATPFTTAMYDTTNMDAGATNGWQQYIAGLSGGKMTIKANYDPSDTNGQLVAITAWAAKTLLYFIVSENGTNTATFTGYIDQYQPHGPVNNKTDVTYSVTITGAVTLA